MPPTDERRPNRWISELRAAPELAAFAATVIPLLAAAPRGDGHPVLVLPGLGADDRSTRPLRWFLRQLGYHVHGWKLGTNAGPTERMRSELAHRMDGLVRRHTSPVSIVGWSLGGVYAHAIARRVPDDVRLVITLGSPLRGTPHAPPHIPMTSIYSRADAIVPWQASVLEPGPRRENIEVRGSHLGLGHNPHAIHVTADRLAQPSSTWQPFHERRAGAPAVRT